jgi:hypothetical protein
MRRITFKRSEGSFIVREVIDGRLEATYRDSFERGYRRMTELVDEGFRESREPREPGSLGRGYEFTK